MTALVLMFLYVPLVVVLLYAFNKSQVASWPPQLWTTKWFSEAWNNASIRPAVLTSLFVASLATVIALVLGALVSFAVHRFHFFGRNALSFALVLPIALPGIVTALALSSMIDAMPLLNYGVPAIVVGHATFCVVVVFNNVIARLRRTAPSMIEASMDLGADGITTFRHVTFPALRTAIVAGGLLAFGLSFDEIVVTIYTAGTTQTLPIWIYNTISKPQNTPEVYPVAVVVLLLAVIPVVAAVKLAGESGLGPGAVGPNRDA
jgi:putative spermidine/putrescine transport system permease protein